MSKAPLVLRLTPPTIAAIRRAAQECWPPGSNVRLFGSRLDPARRGGDIDLLLETPDTRSPSDRVDRRNRFVARLYRLLGEQRIDVLIAPAGAPDNRPVVAVARRNSQLLMEAPA